MFAIGVVDCGSNKFQRLDSILEINNCKVCSIILLKANGYDFTKLDGLVISGGPHLFTNPKTCKGLIQHFKFLDTLEIPTLGICLGHQALAIRHGSHAYLGAERRESETIEVITDHELFYGLPPRFPVQEDHCEGVTLPANFQLLASSASYEVEAMASSTYPHFGVQFHPEISGEAGETIIHNFCNIARKH
ncbi:MAG: gamma-glutamyl-gamma-aminobutyrate hydrolase family protein [Cyanobacteria bacterium P01_F01_bin.33]